MKSLRRYSIIFVLIIQAHGLINCGGDDKPTERCSLQGIEGSATSLAGVWTVQDTAYQCQVLGGRRRYTGQRVDTIGTNGPVFDEAYYEDFWEKIWTDFFTEVTPLQIDCTFGEVSDSTIRVSAFATAEFADKCNSPVEFTTEGSPNDSVWILYDGMNYISAGDSCGLARGDTVRNCIGYKRVYTKLEANPE